jgi:Mg-chelatase subunit ChlD
MTPENPNRSREIIGAKITALLLGELDEEQAIVLRHAIEHDPDLAQLHERLQRTIQLVKETSTPPVISVEAPEEAPRLSAERRQALLQKFKTVKPAAFAKPAKRRLSWVLPVAVAAMLMVMAAAAFLPTLSKSRAKAQHVAGLPGSGMAPAVNLLSENAIAEADQPAQPARDPEIRRKFLARYGGVAGKPAETKKDSANHDFYSVGVPEADQKAASAGANIVLPDVSKDVAGREWSVSSTVRGFYDENQAATAAPGGFGGGAGGGVGIAPPLPALSMVAPPVASAKESVSESLSYGARLNESAELALKQKVQAPDSPPPEFKGRPKGIADSGLVAEKPAEDKTSVPTSVPITDPALVVPAAPVVAFAVPQVAPALKAEIPNERGRTEAGVTGLTDAVKPLLAQQQPKPTQNRLEPEIARAQIAQTPPDSYGKALKEAAASAETSKRFAGRYSLKTPAATAERNVVGDAVEVRRKLAKDTPTAKTGTVDTKSELATVPILGDEPVLGRDLLTANGPQGAVNGKTDGLSPTLGYDSAQTVTNSLADRLERRPDDALPKASPAAPIPQPEVVTRENPFSTFSLNVSDVSFKLAAASLEKGVLPEAASIRSEEFINAFDYHDPEPTPGVPVAFAWERARYPLAQNRDLLRFSIKTAAQGRQAGRPLNLVLVLDNSGSMERADRVRIIREAMRALAAQLQPQDKLSVVTFARTARLMVDGASGDKAGQIAEEVSQLTPQGGTNLEEAMGLGYQTALRHFQANGINRVVFLTDGAANLGSVEPDELKKKVEMHRKQGIALDAFGIGWEGYNDDLLEVLTRNGDGRYGFINSPEEAATEFAGQLAGALRVAASDVKVQVEFNPARVSVYRQIGYAKHQLKKEQFRDNTVDAAEIGAAEAGNALYAVEVNPRGDGPLATVRVRFKVPGTTDYREHEWTVPYTASAPALEQSAPTLRLAAVASAFSEWLAGSPFAGEATPERLLGYLRGVPEAWGADERPRKLEWMLRQATSLGGK